jgi:hypothetical protein
MVLWIGTDLILRGDSNVILGQGQRRIIAGVIAFAPVRPFGVKALGVVSGTPEAGLTTVAGPVRPFRGRLVFSFRRVSLVNNSCREVNN